MYFITRRTDYLKTFVLLLHQKHIEHSFKNNIVTSLHLKIKVYSRYDRLNSTNV